MLLESLSDDKAPQCRKKRKSGASSQHPTFLIQPRLAHHHRASSPTVPRFSSPEIKQANVFTSVLFLACCTRPEGGLIVAHGIHYSLDDRHGILSFLGLGGGRGCCLCDKNGLACGGTSGDGRTVCAPFPLVQIQCNHTSAACRLSFKPASRARWQNDDPFPQRVELLANQTQSDFGSLDLSETKPSQAATELIRCHQANEMPPS